MANFLSEDDIEQADIDLFVNTLGYDGHVNAWGKKLIDRANLREVVFESHLQKALKRLNPDLPAEAIDKATAELTRTRAALTELMANKEVYGYLKDGVPVTYTSAAGKETPGYVRVIDYNQPANNEFLVVSQLSIGYRHLEGPTRRPDLLIYVNGLPLVFIELKNASERVEKGYDDNLQDYRRDIPQLFDYNLLVCISNGIQTRVGAFSTEWGHFFPWARKEDVTRQRDQPSLLQLEAEGQAVSKKISLQYFCEGLLNKASLIDYLENFVLYQQDQAKIIAKNHQFVGVNSAVASFAKNQKQGRQGVFWHTQGSGKSYSMIFYSRKILRKLTGDFSFLIITDRTDLDDQIYRNFLETGAIQVKDGEKKSPYRPKNQKELLEHLQTNRRYVFTLIQKFGIEKGKQFKEVTSRDSWVVMIDEAHRSQYKGLADNLRIALPNAQYIAFTGTPLIKGGITERWFGNYVSEYNFAQAIEDAATVPLFYKKSVPTMVNMEEDLVEKAAEILAKENISDEDQAKLDREYSTLIQVVKRDDRLNTIARHIVRHFPYRLDLSDKEGNRKPMKAMVIAIDKFTAVRMHDKVVYEIKEYIKELKRDISRSIDPEEKEKLANAILFMKETEMAVVVSAEKGEKEKFKKEGLDITQHRKRMVKADEDGRNVEDYFKDANHPLRIVFVTAMWMTGFDAPAVSTLYLDKPLQNHSIMQTIARANRVFAVKRNGLVVDYFGVFRNLKKALAMYAEGSNKPKGEEPDMPLQDFEELIEILKEAIEEGKAFCLQYAVDLQAIIDLGEKGFREIALFETYADRLLVNDDVKKQFTLYTNAIVSLYDSCKPDIYSHIDIKKIKEVFEYLKNVIDRNDDRQERLARTRQKVNELLDESILAEENALQEPEGEYVIQSHKKIDLSKLDFEALRKKFKLSDHKNIEFADLRDFLEQKLRQMIRQNRTRTRFLERFQQIIDEYNNGSNAVEEDFENLMRFKAEMDKEMQRAIEENLTEEELEIFDLLKKEKLSKAELKRVKLAAKDLLERLEAEKHKLFVVDWHKSRTTRLSVQNRIKELLDKGLPDTYEQGAFNVKTDLVFQHIYSSAQQGGKWSKAS
ncbi:MAG: type I restriction endonuclease subunit R [Roseivirga sp.]|nr:type I restriction endonuclease subunit R [Roseivirga sp.]